MRCDPDDSCSGQTGEVVVLELLRHVPRDQVAVRSLAARQALHDALLRDLTLKTNLFKKKLKLTIINNRQLVRQFYSFFINNLKLLIK